MMNLVQKFFSKEKKSHSEVRENFIEHFFSMPEHQWIKGSARANFVALFHLLPTGLLEAMMFKYFVVYVPSEEFREMGTSLTGASTIVIFPEFKKLVQSDKRAAVAYLAHELAFIIYELEEASREPLMAEVEADKFVCDLGLTFELEEFLLMLDESMEKRLRLTYLTINHFSGENN